MNNLTYFSFLNFSMILLFNFCSCQPNKNEKFSITEVTSQTGIYFEELARVKTFYTDWHLVTYVNLTVYNEEYDYINEIINQIQKACDVVDHIIQCNYNLEQIKSLMKEIDEYHVNWFIPESYTNRPKRGLANIVGSGQKILFGVLNEDDAQTYLSEFKQIHAHDDIQDKLIKEQTTLLQSAINMMNNSFSGQKEVVRNILKRIIEDDYNYKRPTMTQAISEVILLIIQFQNKQKLLIEAISIGQDQPNNPILIPPRMFYNELKRIKSSISAKNLDLPLLLNRNSLAMFYHISTAEARIVENQLIISFTLPLVNTEEFILYKSTSLPYKIKDNLFGYIIPNHDYVALDKFKVKYLPITHEELQDCLQLSEQDLVCRETFPVMFAKGTKVCEINLLRQDKDIGNCDVRISNITSEIWIHLKQPNTYIYTLPEKQTIYVACGNITVTRILVNTGIIHVESGCQIKSDNLIITGFETISTVIYHTLTPAIKFHFNMKDFILNISHIETYNIPQIDFPNIIEFGQNKDLEQISLSFKEIQRLEHELSNNIRPINFKKNISFLTYFMIMLTLMIMIVIARYVFKKQKKIRNRYNNTECIYISAPKEPIATPRGSAISNRNLMDSIINSNVN